MKSGFAKLAVVLDRSGSMESIRTDTIGGFNAFVDEQRKTPNAVAVSLFQFDNEYETVYDFVPLEQVKPLTAETFVPRGSTALYDAIGRSIVGIGHRLAAMPESERPESVVFLVITDGLENSSREYRAAQIREMIVHQRDKYNWQFVFIGANQDAILAAGDLGIDASHAMTYQASATGTAAAYKALAKNVARHRAATPAARTYLDLLAFDTEDREEQKKAEGETKKA